MDSSHYLTLSRSIFWAAYIPVDGVGMPKERAANAKIYEQGVRAAVTLCRDNLRRVLLQTGAKLYGVHRRSIPMPLEETMPPHEVGADFYLDQLASTRQLIKECNNSFDYVMTVPGAICGFTRSSYQSLATSLGLYIALKAHLREPAEFPSTRHKYQTGEDMCCASLLAEFDVWCGVTPKCGGETLWACSSPALSFAI